MSKRLNIKGPLSAIALSALVASGVSAATAATVFAETKEKHAVTKVKAPIEDGVYYADVNLVNASNLENYSMGNLSVRGSEGFRAKHPEDASYKSVVIVENGKAHAVIEFMPMGFLGQYGFLSELDEVDTKQVQYGPVESETTYTPARVMSVHSTTDGKAVYDGFNDPSSPSKLDGNTTRPAGYGKPENKPNIVNKPYVHMMSVDVTPVNVEGTKPASTAAEFSSMEGRAHDAFAHVFVPVMFSISPSSGDQYARLHVDWANATKIDNPETNLKYSLYKAMNKESEGQQNYTNTSFVALQNTIKDVRKDLTNIWPSQNIEMTGSGMQAQPKLVQKEFSKAEETEMANKLNAAVKGLEEKGSKESLNTAIEKAEAKNSEKDKFTPESFEKFEEALKAANALAANPDASKAQIEKALADLNAAMAALKEKQAPNPAEKPDKKPDSESDKEKKPSETKLDKMNLADGVYSINGDMIKTNMSEKSMSNNAINHQIKLTVKGGKYYLTMQFKGLKIGDKLGYLENLKYYKTGYTKDKYNAPQGELGNTTVDSYHEGTKYPEYVTFELIPEALKDNLVPLQVFVPVMEAISKGTGTQPVYLSLDWNSLKTAEVNDPGFNDKTIGKGDDSNLPQMDSLNKLKDVKTGDSSNAMKYTVLALAAAGVGGIAVLKIKRKKEEL